MTVSRDRVNQKMVVVQNRCQKRKEHNEICKTAKFEAIDVEVNDKTAIVMLKISTGFVWKETCWMANQHTKCSSRSKIAHLNVSGLTIGNVTKFITLFPFLLSILHHDHFLCLTRSLDTSCKEPIKKC